MRSLLFAAMLPGLVLGLVPGRAHAETVREWLAAAPKAGQIAGLEFRRSPATRGGAPMYDGILPEVSISAAAAPHGGYAGEVSVSLANPDAAAFPLFLSFSYRVIATFRPRNVVSFSGAGTIPVKDAKLTREVFRETIELAPASPLRPVALVIPGALSHGTVMGGAFFIGVELRDAKNKLLSRMAPAEGWVLNNEGSQLVGWVKDEPEGERILREAAGMYASNVPIESYGHQPGEQPLSGSLAEIAALWISKAALDSKQVTALQLQRMILGGTWIYGREESVAAAGRELRLAPGQTVLKGGLAAAGKLSPQSLHNGGYTGALTFSSPQFYPPVSPQTSLQQIEPIFRPYQKLYLRWTFVTFGIFSAFIMLVLPVLFYRLRGRARLSLWYIVPAVSFMTGFASYEAGKIVLPRKPLVRMTEYNFAYAPWTEVLTRTTIKILPFTGADIGFRISRAANYVEPGGAAGDGVRKIIRRGTFAELILEQYTRGGVITSELESFSDKDFPLVPAASGNLLRATTSLRKVFILDRGGYRLAGPMAAGRTFSVLDGERADDPEDLPEWLSQAINLSRSEGELQMIEQRMAEMHDVPPASFGELKTRILKEGVFGDDAIVVAVTDGRPETELLSDAQVTSGVVWIMQFPGMLSGKTWEAR